MGFIYGLVAKVLTPQEVNRDAFIKNFSSLWKCKEDVSIKEIAQNRFWVRFVCDRDRCQVLDTEPWAYRRSLVLLAETPDDGSIHVVPLRYGTFWVQLHGIPGFCMTVAVAQAVGAIFGEVLWVDNRDGDDCVGRFIRIRAYFDVDLPLIYRTLVTLPDIGEKLIEFKYEYLPEYCFACGRLGHSTQVCVRAYEEVHVHNGICMIGSRYQPARKTYQDFGSLVPPRLYHIPAVAPIYHQVMGHSTRSTVAVKS
ncbi:hypothetical protein PRUPE_7G035300 [Prunus persica]|uniref:CCHC-type domain-containing protein n=1 Tax=Prunus persica TaxID=3760 RepID=A0A251N6B0_PRUPE|nr:hypothetical protein PRUPE_7G035300 [Prunus persica]